MTADDVLSYLAAHPKKDRPTELRSDSAMLLAWQLARDDRDFYVDIFRRHGLDRAAGIDVSDPFHEHAISNAWGHCVQLVLEYRKTNA